MSEKSLNRSSIIGFDTSTVNVIEKGSPDSEALMKAILSGFHVLLLGLNAEEVIATPTKKAPLREALLNRCQRLLTSGQCLWPAHHVLERLIVAHFRNPSQFSWEKENMRAKVYERAIIDRDFSDALCAQQRTEQFEAEKKWARMWKGLRPKLDRVLAADPSKRPNSYHEAVVIATIPGGVLWNFGRILYRHITGQEITESEIRAFIDVCPPFRAACYSLVMSWYDHALKPNLPGDLPPAGRNDLMMSAYLAYCGKFVTDDAPQEVSLRDITAEASIECDVLSYENFTTGFMVKL